MLLLLFFSISIMASGKGTSDKTEHDTITGNLYLKFNIDVKHRNILLEAIPRLSSIADGTKFYVGETFGKYIYDIKRNKFKYNEQLRIGTIKHQSTVFPNLLDYIAPHLYDETIIKNYVLSPFNRKNKRFYRYASMPLGEYDFVRFRPRIRNSTLTSGTALINRKTKKIVNAHFTGEFDYINYGLSVVMDTVKNVPEICFLNSQFKFFGNNVSNRLFARYNPPSCLPDTIPNPNSPELMAKVRMDTLTAMEREEYKRVYTEKDIATDTLATEKKHKRNFFDKVNSVLYKYLIRRLRVSNNGSELSMTPILDPMALDYSHHKGLSYRIKLRAIWGINDNADVGLRPKLGYSFKQKQFYFNAPLRYTFDRKRDGWAEFYMSNGNHISNSLLTKKIRNVGQRDTLNFDSLNLKYFRNYEISLKSNIPIGRFFHIGLAAVYHRRSAVNMEKMRELGEKTVYHTFAPSLTLKYTPSSYVSYVFNYERSIPKFLGCDSKYERMEFDAQFAVRYNRLTSLNVHLGAGMYTNMESNDFVDYANFKENYLPDAWDDDWTGRFFLLSSDYYNASKYYIRSNISFESPMLPLAYIPYIGYYIEKERIYISNVMMQKTKPYTEVGYAFTTRYFSLGLFGSFFGTKFQEFGTKIILELFSRW